MPAKYDKEAADQLAESIAADPHLYELADFISGLIGLRTDLERAESRACLLIDILGRGLGARQVAAAHMTVPGKWRRILQISGELDAGAPLTWNPPTETRVRQWRQRFLPRGWRPDHQVLPQTLRQIQAKVIELGVRRAEQLGQFPDGIDPDYTLPDSRQQLIGDGTWVEPYSKAKVVEDPDLGPVKRHSRAKSTETVREQQAKQTLKKHENYITGVLHTVLITETRVGWVFLGGDQTFGGESDSSLRLIEEVVAYLGDRVHTVCYDRGFTGAPANWLMARYGIPLVTVPMPETKPEKDGELRDHRLVAAKGLAAVLPKNDARHSTLLDVRAQRELQVAANATQMREHRDRGLPAGIGRPLGTCYYLTSDANVEKVISEYYEYDTISDHRRADGSVCEHHLYVDDGALWEAQQQGNQWVKARRPQCSPARRVRNSETGGWSMVMDWELRCTETGVVMRDKTCWTPALRRVSSKDPYRGMSKEEAERAKALKALQPLPRCDAAFQSVYGHRNNIEAWFSWYKGTLRKGKSSASLSLDHQLLDLLWGGMVTNSRALRRGRLAGLVDPAAA